jgi:hypothetical protein
MTFTFRPAVRENVPLIIGMIGGTGSGKTYSALELATGLAGGKRFCGIDTESGRMKHYADHFAFDHGDLGPPFRPQHYIEAIEAADKAGYPVVVVDSASHVWAGEDGVLDWQEEELQRMAGDNWQKRESCKMAAWIKPKMAHKHMVQKLLQLRCHLILCFRAEPKVEMVRDEQGKMKIVPKVSKVGKDGWIPICDKNLPFELTMSFLLTDEAPGVPKPIKLERDHRPLVALDKPINRELGAKLAEWAAGAEQKAPVAPSPPASPPTALPSAQEPDEQAPGVISVDQVTVLEDRCKETGIPVARLMAAAKVSALKQITRSDYQRALDWIERKATEGART